MNKTIIININGIVFHIEEDAYELLKNYMTDVKRHFLNSADSLEITTDIENRIAEMFSEILTKESKQVIVEQDVKAIIEQMGTVADFEHAEDDTKSNTHANYTYNAGQRTLFRDPDDYLIAGVCSGLSNYFSIDPVWVRLIFALCFFFGGTGLLLYIILWIVIPKAATRADRMAMKGEKLNLQGFKNNLEEELHAVHGHLSNLQNEARPLIYKFRDLAGDVFYHLGRFFRGTGRVLVKVVGAIILMICMAMAIALVVCLVQVMIWGKGPINLFPLSVIENQYANRVYISAFLIAFIPVLGIMLLTIRAIFNTRPLGRSAGLILFVAWLGAAGVLSYCAAKIAAGFRESANFSKTVSLTATKNNTYYLKLNDLKYFSHDDSTRLNIKNNFQNMVLTDDDANGFHNEPRSVTIKIIRSDVAQPVLEESFSAKGNNYEDALLNARNTNYIFVQQDSVLTFDHTLRKSMGSNWHDEEITLTFKVPLNATLVFDKRLDRYVHDLDLYKCDSMNDEPSPAAFIMTDNGLECKTDSLAKKIITDKVKVGRVKTNKVKTDTVKTAKVK